MTTDGTLRLFPVNYQDLLHLCSVYNNDIVLIAGTNNPELECELQRRNGYTGLMHFARVPDTLPVQHELIGKYSDTHDGKWPKYNEKIGGPTQIQYIDGFVYCIQGRRRNRPLLNITRAVKGILNRNEPTIIYTVAHQTEMPVPVQPIITDTHVHPNFIEHATEWYPVHDSCEPMHSCSF